MSEITTKDKVMARELLRGIRNAYENGIKQRNGKDRKTLEEYRNGVRFCEWYIEQLEKENKILKTILDARKDENA